MEKEDTEPNVIQPVENMDVECNERPPKSNREMRAVQANVKARKLHNIEVRMDQWKTGWAMLFLYF